MAEQSTLPQYDALRKRLQSQFAQQKQETSDSIQRRFAANGMAGAGAYGKAQDEAARQVGNAEADATAQLEFSAANEQQRQKEVGEGRAFAKSEREASQGFASSERQGAQGFASSERQAGQMFSKDLFDRDMAFKQMAFSDESKHRWAEFDESKKANEINAVTALGSADMSSEDFAHYLNQYNQLKGGGSTLGGAAAASGPRPPPGADLKIQPSNGYYWVPGGPNGGMWMKGK